MPRNCFGFALQRAVIGLKNLAPPTQPIRCKTEPIVTWSHAFSRAWGRLRVFALSFHWFIALFTLAVIGHYHWFGFGFTTLNLKPLYQ